MRAQKIIFGKELLKVPVEGQMKHLVVLRDAESTGLFDAHPLVEDFNAKQGTGITVISHKVANAALTNEDTWKRLRKSLNINLVVDAAIAYEKSGRELGAEIVFSDTLSFRIEGGHIIPPSSDYLDTGAVLSRVVLATGKYRGAPPNVALVALGLRSTDFQKDGHEIRLVLSDERLIAVSDFPGKSAVDFPNYMPHPETGVPHGEIVGYGKESRSIYHTPHSSYVGLLTRMGGDQYGRRSVSAINHASELFGVVAEVPDADVPKIEGLIGKRG